MTNRFTIAMILMISLVISACQQDDQPQPLRGQMTFSFTPVESVAGRTTSSAAPAFVLISLEDAENRVQESIKLPLFAFGEGYLSENLQLNPGIYRLTLFTVLDVNNNVLYATPSEGSSLAPFVSDPLPISFEVHEGQSTRMVPEVLTLLGDHQPEDFGYAGFAFHLVASDSSTVLLRLDVKISIGKVLYEQLDYHVRVNGYGTDNSLQWTKDYEFTGPVRVLAVENGHNHYSVELVDKWGINVVLADIPDEQIWEGRADGPTPTTFYLRGSKRARKLSMYLSTMEINVPGQGVSKQPKERVFFEYDANDRLSHVVYEEYNSGSEDFELNRMETFKYENDRVAEIAGPVTERFEYVSLNEITFSRPDQLLHYTRNFEHGINVIQSFPKSTNQYLYELEIRNKNIVKDQSTFLNYNETCNRGEYTYDKHINPFRHLGYLDFTSDWALHWSANNVLTRETTYIGCHFPANVIPVKYDYTYDNEGYPIKKIVTFRNSQGIHPYHEEVHYFYR